MDDDSRLRKSFEKLLADEGHTVQSAGTGEQGLEMVRSSPPDLVIMDFRLPGINGIEAFRAIRQIEPDLPVIIMTAYGTDETADEATRLGAFDYVQKPFDIPQMLTLIRQALDAS